VYKYRAECYRSLERYPEAIKDYTVAIYDNVQDTFMYLLRGDAYRYLEDYEHAKARGAKIYAEVTGYGATSDGYDMVQPSGEGAVRCMQQAMATVDSPVDYINAHGTSTPVGDIRELEAVKEAFSGMDIPMITSTKSLSGHALGAAGVHEAIYSLLMQENNFIAASANIIELDEGAVGVPIVREKKENVELKTIMSNSFGFGGTNATLIFRKL
jgi:3-oxoacyl-[acyl-carrier-protein] synthase-1